MGKHFVIAGAGFRGFCDALTLLKTPGNTIEIIDGAPFFGGVMYSLMVDGFHVDKGVHVFDSIPVELAEVITEIMDGQTREIDFVSASAFNGKVTDGFSLPDLSSTDAATKEKIRAELLEMAKNPPNGEAPATLRAHFEQRYGATAAGIFCDIFHKVYGISADEVEPTAIAQTSMGRLKFLDDPDMLDLKKDPWLDTVLAARRAAHAAAGSKVDDFVSIYPDNGEAMKGWCDRAQAWLEAKGVKVRLGEKIQTVTDTGSGVKLVTDKGEILADHLIWANDNVDSLAKAMGLEDRVDTYQHGTPMVFVTLMTQASEIRDFTYLQNFDPDQLTYRTAAAGLFSDQVREDGISFVTCECPAEIGGRVWEAGDAIASEVWDEIRSLGVVSEKATLVGQDVKRIPTTFKLAKLGYRAHVDAFCEKVTKTSPHVVVRNVVPFFRRDIYFDSAHLNDLAGAA